METGAGKIEESIVMVRGHRVMLDASLARLYGVSVKVLNQAVRRNRDRFPADFMFPLTLEEGRVLRSQIVTLDGGRGRHRKYPPLAFTEQGVAMLSSVLRSQRAVRVNIAIMRAFVRLRLAQSMHHVLAAKLAELEGRIGTHDDQIEVIFQAIRELMTPAATPKRRIGFHAPDRESA